MVTWITAIVPSQLDAAGASPDEAEPIIIELRLGRLVSRTVSGFRVEDDALIPLTKFLDLAEVYFQVHDDGRLEATFQPSGSHLSIDAARYKVQMDGRFIQSGPSQLFVQDGEYYIATGLLGGVLGLRFDVNWSDLRVTLVDAGGLPIARRIQRERARNALLRRRGGLTPDLTLGPRRNRWDGLVMDYSFGGSLTLSAESVGEAGTGDVRMRGSWSGVWQEDPWLKQLHVGDGFATGPRSRALRGVSVTNSPFIRSSILGNIVYDGRLDPGWQVEAYQGRLVAFDSVGTTGLYAVELPVQYGENPVDLVAYGPFGEERRFNRTYRVSRSLLPQGSWEYGAAAGECVTLKCEGTLNADIRYGATERITFRAGFDRFWRDTLPDLNHPYLSVAASPTNAWTLEVEGAHKAFGRGVLRYTSATIDHGPTGVLSPEPGEPRLVLRGKPQPIPHRERHAYPRNIGRIRTGARRSVLAVRTVGVESAGHGRDEHSELRRHDRVLRPHVRLGQVARPVLGTDRPGGRDFTPAHSSDLRGYTIAGTGFAHRSRSPVAAGRDRDDVHPGAHVGVVLTPVVHSDHRPRRRPRDRLPARARFGGVESGGRSCGTLPRPVAR